MNYSPIDTVACPSEPRALRVVCRDHGEHRSATALSCDCGQTLPPPITDDDYLVCRWCHAVCMVSVSPIRGAFVWLCVNASAHR